MTDEQGCDQGRRGRSGGYSEQLDVGVHVEHDEPAQRHSAEWKGYRKERQSGELKPNGGQEPQCEYGNEAGDERSDCDDDSELRHGVKR
jgi:hypothetical protein